MALLRSFCPLRGNSKVRCLLVVGFLFKLRSQHAVSSQISSCSTRNCVASRMAYAWGGRYRLRGARRMRVWSAFRPEHYAIMTFFATVTNRLIVLTDAVIRLHAGRDYKTVMPNIRFGITVIVAVDASAMSRWSILFDPQSPGASAVHRRETSDVSQTQVRKLSPCGSPIPRHSTMCISAPRRECIFRWVSLYC